MKHLVYSLLFAVFLVAGCSDDRPKLYVYNWSDYIDPDLTSQFEAENNCKVVIDTFDDNESMLAKLLAGGGGYDVIFPSSYATPVMVRGGMIEPLDLSKLPNVVTNLDYKFKQHFHQHIMKYSVPYAFSETGIVYRRDKLPKDYVVKHSWNLLKDPVFHGRMNMFRDVREVFGLGLRMCGYSVNTTNEIELAAAVQVMKSFKKCAAKLDNEQYRTGIVSAEVNVSMGYACDVIQLQIDTPDCPIEFFIPDEGSTCCWDEIVISKKSTKKDLAHKFIDFLYRPQAAAKNATYICATVPNKNMWSYLPEQYRNNPLLNVTKDVLDKLELIQDLGDQLQLYSKGWDIFTTNRD